MSDLDAVVGVRTVRRALFLLVLVPLGYGLHQSLRHLGREETLDGPFARGGRGREVVDHGGFLVDLWEAKGTNVARLGHEESGLPVQALSPRGPSWCK